MIEDVRLSPKEFKRDQAIFIDGNFPTITSRPLGGAQIKATLMIPLRDDPLYIRLTNEDTPQIRSQMVKRAMHYAHLGIPVKISGDNYQTPVIEKLLTVFKEVGIESSSVEIKMLSDQDFYKVLNKSQVKLLTSSPGRCIASAKLESHFLCSGINTIFSPFEQVGKSQSVKATGTIDQVNIFNELREAL